MKLKNRMKKNIVLMLLLALVLGVGYAPMEKTVYAAEEDETPADNEDGGYSDDPSYYQDLSTPTPTPSATPYKWVVEVTPEPVDANKYYTDEETGYTYDHSGFYIKDGTLISFYDLSKVDYLEYQGYMFIDPVDEDGVLHLPDGITRIAAGAFEEVGVRVKKIIIPKTVTKIDDAALYLDLIIEFENSNCDITSKAFMDIEGESAAIYASIIAQKNSNVWKAAVEAGCVVPEDATVKPIKSKLTFMTYGNEVGRVILQNVTFLELFDCTYSVSDKTAIHVEKDGTISTGGKPGNYKIYVTVPKENKTFTIQVKVQKRTAKSVVKYIKNYVFTKGMTTKQKKDQVLHWLSHYMYYDSVYWDDTESVGDVLRQKANAFLPKTVYNKRHMYYHNSNCGIYAIVHGLSVCQGHALGAKYLLEQTVKGLKVKYATLVVRKHAYIRIKEGKKWVNEDVSTSASINTRYASKWIYSIPGYNGKTGKDALTYASVVGMTPEEWMQQDSSDDDDYVEHED